MATNADFDSLIVRITTATNTLETDVATITAGAENVSESVASAQLAASQAAASATNAQGQVTLAANQVALATTQAGNAAASAAQAQATAEALEDAVIIQEAPEDSQTYGRNNGNWVVVTSGGGGGAVDSVNGQTGVVVLSASDVGAKPSSYVPTWSEVTGKPTTFAPTIGTTADTALAGNTVIPTNTNQLTNGAGFVTAATAPVRSVAGKTGVVTLAGEDIASGVVAPARLGTGTPSSTTVLKGDGTWGSVPPATGGYPIVETSIQYNGAYITQWPLANPNDAAQLSLFGAYIEGDFVEGAAMLNTQTGVNYLPAGNYWFPAGAWGSGVPFNGSAGMLTIERVSATEKKAVVHTFTQPAAQYMWTISGSTVTWQKVGDGVYRPGALGGRGTRPTTVFENFTDPAQTLASLLATLTASGVPGGLTYMFGAQNRTYGPFGATASGGLMCKWEVYVNYDASGNATSIDQIVTGLQSTLQGKIRYATKTSSGTPSWNLGTAT